MTTDGVGAIEKWSGFKSWIYSLILGNPERSKAIVQFAGVGPGDRVLDVGCGPGSALRHALDAGAESAAGVDPSPSMVKRAANNVPEACFSEGSAEELPYEDGSFTKVWSVAAYHHWANQDRGVAEVMRVLERSGAFYLAERQLKKGTRGHGISEADAAESAQHISETFGVSARVEKMKAGSATYLVVIGEASG
ncbi:MAG: class I SAM-dependent methyltransferase [Acidimicrobiia bacterium]|nr:class I SAM-dependent methyltransferase [Acidimicrobiia bacterium]MDH3462341.1 class I SAM-dependent methyltransferase [Acidimicrobiia bacterium]